MLTHDESPVTPYCYRAPRVQKVKPAFRAWPPVYGREPPRIKPQLRLIKLDSCIQFSPFDLICLEVHQPDLTGQQHHQIGLAFGHHELAREGFPGSAGVLAGSNGLFRSRRRGRWSTVRSSAAEDGRSQGSQFRGVTTNRERHFPPDIPRLSANLSANLRFPERPKRLKIQLLNLRGSQYAFAQ